MSQPTALSGRLVSLDAFRGLAVASMILVNNPGTWDPEGFLSTLPAVATALLGVFAGQWLRSMRQREEIAKGLLAAGCVGVLAGLLWDHWFPINKNLWTSSYVVFTAGAALMVLAPMYWVIDVKGSRRAAVPKTDLHQGVVWE